MMMILTMLHREIREGLLI